MRRIVVVFAFMLLHGSWGFSQEESRSLFASPPCDGGHRDLAGLSGWRDNACNSPGNLLRAARPWQVTSDDANSGGAGDAQAGGGSGNGSQSHSNKAGTAHYNLVELSSANWHPLTSSEKFGLFSQDLRQWTTHASLALDAGMSLATNDRPFLGRGGWGYLRRYGFNIADEANYTFFCAFLFPTLFHEDPRYIPLDQGTNRARVVYALSRVIFTRKDAGHSEINKSLILGTIVSTAIANTYYAAYGGSSGAGVIFANVGIGLASDAGFNVFKETWPNLSRKLKLNLWIRNIVRSGIRDSIKVY